MKKMLGAVLFAVPVVLFFHFHTAGFHMDQLKATLQYSSNEVVRFEELVVVAKEITSRPVLERIVGRLGLTSAENEEDHLDEILASLQESIFVEIKQGSNLIDIRVKDTPAEEAILLINTTVQEYLTYRQTAKPVLSTGKLSIIQQAKPLKRSYPDRHWSQLFVIFILSSAVGYFTLQFFHKNTRS